MTGVEVTAPGKINYALEVVGRRPDGYHEVVSLMQTVDLAGRVRVEASSRLEIEVAGEEVAGVPREGPANLAFRAAEFLSERHAAGRGALIVLEKGVPVGMGLGGGASDAAATLRGLNLLWDLGLGLDELMAIGAEVGSDVPFFLIGGTAAVSGRGEVVEPLPDLPPQRLVVLTTELTIRDKTRRMYAALTPSHFSDGQRATVAVAAARRGLPLAETDLVNTFDTVLEEAAPVMAVALRACRSAGLACHVTGSGPGLYVFAPMSALPRSLLSELERLGVQARPTRSLTRAESVAHELY
jgi:4-diphosphocytidyl-2-C-methyl-D-erythritol kinase